MRMGPKCASSAMAPFGASTATRSPGPTPSASSAEASRLTRALNSAYVKRRSPSTTATASRWA